MSHAAQQHAVESMSMPCTVQCTQVHASATNALESQACASASQAHTQGGHTCPWKSGSIKTSQMVALNAWSLVARAKPTSFVSGSFPFSAASSNVKEHTCMCSIESKAATDCLDAGSSTTPDVWLQGLRSSRLGRPASVCCSIGARVHVSRQLCIELDRLPLALLQTCAPAPS